LIEPFRPEAATCSSYSSTTLIALTAADLCDAGTYQTTT